MAPNPVDSRVLSTLNQDGTRFVVRPRLAKGRFLLWRQIVAYGLIALFAALPFIRINGRPALLIDLTTRELSAFGMVFRPSDGFLLMLLGITVVATVFLVTALLGRVWCGWGCPQTVYLEHIFRPIERWLEGNVAQQRKLDASKRPSARRVLKWAIYLVLSFLVANIFLAYFVGSERLFKWISNSPAEHPVGFAIVMGVTALMYFDFAYFREQTCILACPYGRLQSVLIDERSLIIGYDEQRGEPRGKPNKKLPVLADAPKAGACIDCGACVAVCPTGIDIRQGLQMECVGCAQCIDACDDIMDKVKQPRGLVRYTSKAQLMGKAGGLLRPRTIIYPAILVLAASLLVFNSGRRNGTEVWVLRLNSATFVDMGQGKIASALRIKLENKSDHQRKYKFTLVEPANAYLRSPMPEWTIASHHSQEVPLFVDLPATAFTHGKHPAIVRVTDNEGTSQEVKTTLFGPEHAQ